MKFLVDNAISPLVAISLKNEGFDSVHVRDYDTDFSFILAQRNSTNPSVILFRKGSDRNPFKQVELLLANLKGSIEKDLNDGSIVIIEKTRIRVRRLPLFPATSE